jgi:hypothetical protein
LPYQKIKNGWELPAQLRKNEQNVEKCHKDAFLSVKKNNQIINGRNKCNETSKLKE